MTSTNMIYETRIGHYRSTPKPVDFISHTKLAPGLPLILIKAIQSQCLQPQYGQVIEVPVQPHGLRFRAAREQQEVAITLLTYALGSVNEMALDAYMRGCLDELGRQWIGGIALRYGSDDRLHIATDKSAQLKSRIMSRLPITGHLSYFAIDLVKDRFTASEFTNELCMMFAYVEMAVNRDQLPEPIDQWAQSYRHEIHDATNGFIAGLYELLKPSLHDSGQLNF